MGGAMFWLLVVLTIIHSTPIIYCHLAGVGHGIAAQLEGRKSCGHVVAVPADPGHRAPAARCYGGRVRGTVRANCRKVATPSRQARTGNMAL